MVQFLGGTEDFFFPKFPHPSSISVSGCRGHFLRGQSSRDMKLTDHLHIVQRLRMMGAIPPHTDMPPWPAVGQRYLYSVVYRKFQADVSEVYDKHNFNTFMIVST